MYIITLISDWGNESPELAVLKGQLLAAAPDARIVDIAHNIKPFDLNAAAYMARQTSSKFPSGSIHLLLVDTEMPVHKKYILTRTHGQYFISADNGIFSLLFDSVPECYEIYNETGDSYSWRDAEVCADVCRYITGGGDPAQKYIPAGQIKSFSRRNPVSDDKHLSGSIIYIDNYGNLVTEITREQFENSRKGRRFNLTLRTHDRHEQINRTYSDVKEGEIVCIFNSSGLLEIALYRENAHKLLGMNTGMQVIFEFY